MDNGEKYKFMAEYQFLFIGLLERFYYKVKIQNKIILFLFLNKTLVLLEGDHELSLKGNFFAKEDLNDHYSERQNKSR